MFDGLRSRCSTSCECANSTAASTCRNKRKRSRIDRRCVVAVRGERLAVDVLHRQVRLAGRARRRRRRAARCSDASSVARMSRSRLKRSANSAWRGPWNGSFSATSRCSWPSPALREPDRAHAAAADLANQAIGADLLAGWRRPASAARAARDRRPGWREIRAAGGRHAPPAAGARRPRFPARWRSSSVSQRSRSSACRSSA